MRAKAINPVCSESDLAEEFGMDRSTVYKLLKEHGLQDLPRIIDGSELDKEPMGTIALEKKTTTEIVPCQQALLLSLLNPLAKTGFMDAMASLQVPELERYSNEQLWLCLVFLVAWGVFRISYINDQSIEDWGVLLDSSRRPDGDTLDQYLNRLIELDEVNAEMSVIERQGQICPGGLIDLAQQASLRNWVSADLLAGDIWYFDGNKLEYTGKAKLDKTKHGTGRCCVKAIKRYTLQNGWGELNEYFPSHITFAEALRILVTKANNCLPEAHKIRKLSFDREGWVTPLLNWLQKQQIISLTWVKKTTSNVQSLLDVSDEEFITIERPFGIDAPQQNIVYVADTETSFDSLGVQRTVILETDENKRIGIYTTALKPHFDNEPQSFKTSHSQLEKANQYLKDNQPLLLEETTKPVSLEQNERLICWTKMTTTELLDAIRFKLCSENQFFVPRHEMGSDVLPTHTTYQTNVVKAYDIFDTQNQLDNASKRLQKYALPHQQQQQLHLRSLLNKHQLNIDNKRIGRLQQQTERFIPTITFEMDHVRLDKNDDIVLLEPT